MMIVGLLVRLDSPGPALFRQQRTGYRGRPFTVYKIRTMKTAVARTASDQQLRQAAMTLVDDPRITRLGSFLRRTRLDELPQLINIAKGEMSLIGPRPEAVALSQWYEKQIPFYHYRHLIKPGVTGWAQINQGHVTDVADVQEKLHLDFYYVKNFSFWLDVLIAVRTVKTMISGHGAR
jgi:lipopolysaccharide/colanic/teichoic acid biosynthesis glycosyltransferase